MRVKVLIQYNPFFQSSASANRWRTLLEGIALKGVTIDLLIYGGFTCTKEKEKFGVTGSFKGINYQYVLPFLIQGYWKVRFHNYIGLRFRTIQILKTLLTNLKNEKGIIWTDASILSFRLAIRLKKQNTKAKLFTEMSEFLDIHHYNKGNLLQRWQGDAKQRLFEKHAYFAYNGMALMTRTLINHYASLPVPQPKLIHLPMTVDLERFQDQKLPPKEFKSPYIAFVGVMNDAKDGVSILIKAFDQLKDRFPSYKLYLVGPWNYDTPTHLKLLKENGLEGRVFWMQEYNRDLIPDIIGSANLLVLPRPDSKQAQGGFPTKLGEYLATGNPVCATRVGEIPDYLTDNESVFFADPGSVESFADAMNRALSDPENARRVGANGRRVAEKEFNKEIQAKKLYDFFQQLIAS